jgi:hypothetical protein
LRRRSRSSQSAGCYGKAHPEMGPEKEGRKSEEIMVDTSPDLVTNINP